MNEYQDMSANVGRIQIAVKPYLTSILTFFALFILNALALRFLIYGYISKIRKKAASVRPNR